MPNQDKNKTAHKLSMLFSLLSSEFNTLFSEIFIDTLNNDRHFVQEQAQHQNTHHNHQKKVIQSQNNVIPIREEDLSCKEHETKSITVCLPNKNALIKPESPYIKFFKKTRKEIVQESPDLPFSEITSEISSRWKLVSEKEKERQNKDYEKERSDYEAQLAMQQDSDSEDSTINTISKGDKILNDKNSASGCRILGRSDSCDLSSSLKTSLKACFSNISKKDCSILYEEDSVNNSSNFTQSLSLELLNVAKKTPQKQLSAQRSLFKVGNGNQGSAIKWSNIASEYSCDVSPNIKGHAIATDCTNGTKEKLQTRSLDEINANTISSGLLDKVTELDNNSTNSGNYPLKNKRSLPSKNLNKPPQKSNSFQIIRHSPSITEDSDLETIEYNKKPRFLRKKCTNT